MQTVYEIIELFLSIVIISIIANILTSHIDPLEWIKDRIGLGQQRKLKSHYFIVNTIIYTFWKLITCVNCVSYWITVIYFLPTYDGFYFGFLSYALSAWLYNNVFNTKINF